MAITITQNSIFNKEKDLAGYWRVWVDIGDGNLWMFKYKEDPTLQQLQTDVTKREEYLAIANSKEFKIEELTRQRDLLNEEIAQLESK